MPQEKGREERQFESVSKIAEEVCQSIRSDLGIAEVEVGQQKDYVSFRFNVGPAFVDMSVTNHPDGPVLNYTVFESRHQFLMNPSFGKHPILSDIRLRGPLPKILHNALSELRKLAP